MLDELKSLSNRNELAVLLGYRPKNLAYIVYGLRPEYKYSEFQVAKRSGGFRSIHAPCPELKQLQKNLRDVLQQCIEELASINKAGSISHGFKPNHSILTNADVHKGRRYVFNIDLADFFPSIHLGRIIGFFTKNRDFSLNSEVATTIAQIACFDGRLPQGSPCSPIISNLIAHIIDVRLSRLAHDHGCTYSRYADDLTFSTGKKDFPLELAFNIGDQWSPSELLQGIIRRSGFEINPAKTRMDYRMSRQTVTGIIVNKKLNAPSDVRRNARAMAHRLFQTGAFQVKKVVEGAEVLEDGNISYLLGIYSYFYMIYNMREKHTLDSLEKTHADLLFYDRFYNAQKPVFLCEGKTDNVYLRHALKALARSYPEFVKLDGEGAHLLIRLFNHTPMVSRVLELRGGSDYLRDFISRYASRCSTYRATPPASPVFIIIDNDSGARPVYSLLKQLKKLQVVDGMEPFYYVAQNLYVIPTPKVNAAVMSKIEDCFDAETKSVKIRNKTFNPENDTDSTTQYSKHVFAEAVVKKNAATIDFSGFIPLLNNIRLALTHYHSVRS